MIISRTPYRISFIGGGTDYPSWYLKHGGKTIGTTINKYSYINCRVLPPFFDHRFRIVYSVNELVKKIQQIRHPSVRETLKYLNINTGLEIHHDGDLPARTGVGSSSAFTVGLLKALHALEGRMASKRQLAKQAIHIEQNLIKESVGSQDQIWAAYGGLNTIEFLKNGEFVVRPLILKPGEIKKLENKFMLFFTGISRIASAVAKEQIKNISKRTSELNQMKDLVGEAVDIFEKKNKNFKYFGNLLHESWKLKKSLSKKIVNNKIDSIYDTALRNGATGGKLLGAGGGGFILFYVEPEYQPRVKKTLKNLLQVPFKFDFTGSEIVVYKPNA